MQVIIFKGYWTIGDVKSMPNYLFIFGDNDVSKGKGGQAIIRDEINSIGIPTKKYPNNNTNSFYYDSEYDKNIIKIDNAIKKIMITLKTNDYKGIVLPEDGFGTGLARLNTFAPKTLQYINNKVNELKEYVKLTNN